MKYRVIGIIQQQISGRWSESTINDGEVSAVNVQQAKELVLARYERYARNADPMAIVRWNTPSAVQALPV